MICAHCFAQLTGKIRNVKIDKATYTFCPSSNSPIVTDCLNEFLLRYNQKKQDYQAALSRKNR